MQAFQKLHILVIASVQVRYRIYHTHSLLFDLLLHDNTAIYAPKTVRTEDWNKGDESLHSMMQAALDYGIICKTIRKG